MSLLTEYSPWFLLICLITGAVFSFGLYYRSRKRPDKPVVLYALLLLRFFSVSLLTFLLLTPLVRTTTRLIEKPLIVIGVDGSQSMVSSSDSAEVRKELRSETEKLQKELSDRYEVALFTFGQNVSSGLPKDFKAKYTDISEFISDLGSRFANRNLGAVVIASDGIYNKGTNPYYAAQNLTVPVYSIAVGDTSLYKDILIKNISVSRQVYLDDQFPFQVMVEMDKLPGKEVRLNIRHLGMVVYSRPVAATGERSVIRLSGMLQAKEKGIQKYSVEVEGAGEEFNKANNKRDFYVEVLESRILVALVYESPHPDISAIVSALASTAKFQITQLNPSELLRNPGEYDLYIFYQLPAASALADPSKLLPAGSPVLYFVGSQTDIAGFNRLKTGLVINSQRKNITDIQAVVNPDFFLFGLDRQTTALVPEFPPLQCPSGTFETGVTSDVLFYQKISNVNTKFPLFMFFDLPSHKTGIIAGENIWRWRIWEYVNKTETRNFDNLICLIAQYLSARNDPSPFRVNFRNRIEEGDPLEFDATLFNPNHELINQPDATLELKNEEGMIYPFTFSRTEKAYYLNAGFFPPGNYSFEARVRTSGAMFKKEGHFSITPLDLEFVNLVADHALLKKLSSRFGGQVISRKDMPKLAGLLKNRSDLKPIIHLQRRYSDLTGEWWMFVLIIVLLFAEWAVRKRNGM
ncbi:MAG: hypothetical protein WCO02_02455 [Bacteroidota bacterium]